MINNITIADKSRLEFIINFLSRFGVTDVHIQKENYGYDVSFGEDANFIAINALSKMFPNEDDGENISQNCVIISIPSIFD